MARTSNTVLHKSGKSGHPCLVSNPRENAFSFSTLNIMLAVGQSYMAFIMLKYVLSILTLRVESFYHKYMLNFVKSFFCIC